MKGRNKAEKKGNAERRKRVRSYLPLETRISLNKTRCKNVLCLNFTVNVSSTTFLQPAHNRIYNEHERPDGSSPTSQSETWKSKARTTDKSFSYFFRKKKRKYMYTAGFTFVADKADTFLTNPPDILNSSQFTGKG